MSLYEQLKKNIENTIYQYTEVVSQKYNIDQKEILELFNGENTINVVLPKKQTKKTLDNVDMNDLSSERLSKCTKPELSALCKSKGLKCTGTKDVLLQRLLEKDDNGDKLESKKNETVGKKTQNKKVEVKSKKASNTNPAVIQKLVQETKQPLARRNEHGNFFYPGTRIVLDKKANAIGVQEDDGTVSDLTDDDIDECKKYKISYKMPTNLDKKTDLENIKVEELDEDNLENTDEIVEEEEIEEIQEIEDDE